MPKKLKIFSFFSGSGFLDLGFEKSGYEIQFVNENHGPFMEAYKYSRKQMHMKKPVFGYFDNDVQEFLTDKEAELTRNVIKAKQDHSLVGFIGGPPCPDFSIAGKNRGRNGDNGKLSLTYINIIIDQHPDFFLFENVKGLWRTARHRAFYEELKGMLSKAGYTLTERLNNALEFGAAQDRDRILLFGIRNELAKQNPIKNFNWQKYEKYSLDDVKALPWPTTDKFVENSVTPCPKELPKELTVEYWFEKNDVYHHPNANDFFKPRGGKAKMEVIPEGDVSKKSYKRLHRWRYSPTAAYGNNEVHLHPYKVRRISAAEAMAIQSLPKDFVLPEDMTLTNKFKTIGNGVPFVLANGVAKTMHDYLEEF